MSSPAIDPLGDSRMPKLTDNSSICGISFRSLTSTDIVSILSSSKPAKEPLGDLSFSRPAEKVLDDLLESISTGESLGDFSDIICMFISVTDPLGDSSMPTDGSSIFPSANLVL